jgi:hypothetical protein
MHDTNAITALNRLPANATFGEAMEWVTRMRRLIDRWDTLPESATRSMTPELRQEAYAQLDVVEETIHRDMAMANS